MTSSRFLLLAVFCLAVVAVCDGWWFIRRKPSCKRTVLECGALDECSKCNVLRSSPGPRTVTLRAVNVLREPTFSWEHTLRSTRAKTLFYMLEQAADANSAFKFKATYFAGELGYFIESINNTAGDWALDKSYWQILDGDSNPTTVGASTYVPKNGETVTFNLTFRELVQVACAM